MNFNSIDLILNIHLNNPTVPYEQAFSVTLNIDTFSYASSNAATISLSNASVTQMQMTGLTALPTAAGADAIYILRVNGSEVEHALQLTFPQYFIVEDEATTSTIWSNDSYWSSNLSYFELLQQSYLHPQSSSLLLD